MLHRWDVSVEEAMTLQERLRAPVQQTGSIALDQVRAVAGIDASYGDVGQAAIVIFSLPMRDHRSGDSHTREHLSLCARHVPGLPSLRE